MSVPSLPATGPRVLLRRLREVMAGAGTAEERLAEIVRVIASNMVAEVCSVYLLRHGESLELFATEGLDQSAVHNTRMRVGVGLVGDIAAHARPLNLDDAWSHPAFSYRPETGEDEFHSFLGVPILRDGQAVGVVAVQNRAMRVYSEEEEEALQTVAMVLAEMVGAGELINIDELATVQSQYLMPQRLEGTVLSGGLAQGTAVMHKARIEVPALIADDPAAELTRLHAAVDEMRLAIDGLLAAHEMMDRGEHREVLEAYSMFAQDRGWLARLEEAIATGLTAEAAVKRVQVDMRARMMAMTDPLLRERLHDLEDLANRLLRHLTGTPDTAAGAHLPDAVILVARHLGPAELLDYDRHKLKGVLLEEGSPTAHVAVVARAMGIPILGNARGIGRVLRQGDHIILDCEHAQAFLRPTPDVVDAIASTMTDRAERAAKLAQLRDVPAVTLDGVEIDLHCNAGLLVDVAHMGEAGAAGIGLYRTELPFMVRSTFPDVTSQIDLYQQVLTEVGDKPVVFRTLDVGGDKVLPYFSGAQEENPAMGWRAVRIGLDRPRLLRQQMRALTRAAAAAGAPLHIMFPMIADVSEFLDARALLRQECDDIVARGGPMPPAIHVGTMLEVPSLVWQLDSLLQYADFVSIGSNDLMQFMFAADRGNPDMAERYDPLSPAMLLLLRDVLQKCRLAGVPVSVCGEMAGRPLEAMALIGLGFQRLSMSPGAIGAVKAMLRSMRASDVGQYLDTLMTTPAHSLRGHLQNFARDRGISI